MPRRVGTKPASAPSKGPAKNAAFYGLGPLVFDAKGNLYVGEAGTADLSVVIPAFASGLSDNTPRVGARIQRITPGGACQTIAGDGTTVMNDPNNGDVLGTPTGLVFDLQGRLVVVDEGTNQLKLLTLPQ